MRKFSSERSVWAPQYLSPGTWISPKASLSVRVEAAILLVVAWKSLLEGCCGIAARAQAGRARSNVREVIDAEDAACESDVADVEAAARTTRNMLDRVDRGSRACEWTEKCGFEGEMRGSGAMRKACATGRCG